LLFCILLFAVASLLAAATAFIKSISISNQIEETEAKIQKLEFSVTSVPTATSTSTSIESKLSALQILLEKSLITKEEYEAKKTELLQRL
jgi:outer membrane lipoprotein-sorting protein